MEINIWYFWYWSRWSISTTWFIGSYVKI